MAFTSVLAPGGATGNGQRIFNCEFTADADTTGVISAASLPVWTPEYAQIIPTSAGPYVGRVFAVISTNPTQITITSTADAGSAGTFQVLVGRTPPSR